MQIVRTEILDAIALDGQAVRGVVFCGEGNECVTVDMANLEGEGDDALARAKAILVQTATFGMIANDYDATSNGRTER